MDDKTIVNIIQTRLQDISKAVNSKRYMFARALLDSLSTFIGASLEMGLLKQNPENHRNNERELPF